MREVNLLKVQIFQGAHPEGKGHTSGLPWLQGHALKARELADGRGDGGLQVTDVQLDDLVPGPFAVVVHLDADLYLVRRSGLLWGDLPDAWVYTGTAIVVASGLYILRREMTIRARGRAA